MFTYGSLVNHAHILQESELYVPLRLTQILRDWIAIIFWDIRLRAPLAARASDAKREALSAYMRALRRYTNFIINGILPGDLP